MLYRTNRKFYYALFSSLLFHYLPNDFSANINPSSYLRIRTIGFDRNLSFINSRRMMLTMGTWFDISLLYYFLFLFFLIVIKWISLYFSSFSLSWNFFVMSSFSCETLYGELHLFFIIIMLVLKRCLAQLSKLAELKRRRKKIKKSTIINRYNWGYNKTWEAKKKKENN